MSQIEGRELGWEGVIENDGPEFVTLPDGDYDFTVTAFERARHNGSDKLPPCNKAILTIRLDGQAGSSTVKHNMFLHTITEGMLCAFFTAIGQRKRGEKLEMNWNKVVGGKGRCKVTVREWKSEKGNILTSNEIKKFYEPDEQSQQAFQPGRF